PCIRWAVVEQTEIGAAPWQRASQAESRRYHFARDAEPFCIRSNLKLRPGEPGAVQRCRQFAKITVTKNRRIQNIDRFVVETFKDRTCKISVRVNDQDDSSWYARNLRRTTENQTGDIVVDDELKTEERRDRSHVDMPPIGAKREALEPFRAINSTIRPFIGDLRL